MSNSSVGTVADHWQSHELSQATPSKVPSSFRQKNVRLGQATRETHLTQHAAQVVVLLDEQVVQGLDARPPVQDETCAINGGSAWTAAPLDQHTVCVCVPYGLCHILLAHLDATLHELSDSGTSIL